MPIKPDTFARELHTLLHSYINEFLSLQSTDFWRIQISNISVSTDRSNIICTVISEFQESSLIPVLQPIVHDLRSKIFIAYHLRVRPEFKFQLPQFRQDTTRIMQLIDELNHEKK